LTYDFRRGIFHVQDFVYRGAGDPPKRGLDGAPGTSIAQNAVEGAPAASELEFCIPVDRRSLLMIWFSWSARSGASCRPDLCVLRKQSRKALSSRPMARNGTRSWTRRHGLPSRSCANTKVNMGAPQHRRILCRMDENDGKKPCGE